MPVNTTANTASALSEPTPCSAAGATDSSATAPICIVVNAIGRSRFAYAPMYTMCTREQHRAREREQLAAPEVHSRRR